MPFSDIAPLIFDIQALCHERDCLFGFPYSETAFLQAAIRDKLDELQQVILTRLMYQLEAKITTDIPAENLLSPLQNRAPEYSADVLPVPPLKVGPAKGPTAQERPRASFADADPLQLLEIKVRRVHI